MPTAIDIREFPSRLDEALALTAAGREVLLLVGTTPCARLIPIEKTSERIAGLHTGAMVPADDFDAPLSDDFWTRRQ